MSISNRKNEHVSISEKLYNEMKQNDFDCLKFIHHSLPGLDVAEVDISTSLASFNFPYPFFINSMTGGSEWTKKINEDLSIVARETALPIASGSLKAALREPIKIDTFRIIREVNPKGIVIANIGAGLNYEDAKRAIDILQADLLQIHVNAPQELVMIDGDREFSKWISNIEGISNNINIPIIVKEVGFGMSRETIRQLKEVGVKLIDISGRGGTNFAQIENFKRSRNKYDYLEDWGQSSVVSLLEGSEYMDKIEFIASGGVRSPLDIVKALSLGAKMVGVAGLILHTLLKDGVENTIKEINSWKEQISVIMTLLGKKVVSELCNTDMLITGTVKEYCEIRNIDYKKYAFRY